MKTSHVCARDVQERWLLYDASEHTLGRMATDIAMRLMGKDRPTYTPSELTGARVVVIHSARARVGGDKEGSKTYMRFTGYAGGLWGRSLADLRAQRPNEIVKLAVRRMLPKSKLGKRMMSRLKVYPGAEHPHTAQKPVKVESLAS
ncbi:MAG: 50S ribosomal protein L13 [Planctomycetota bacterium]